MLIREGFAHAPNANLYLEASTPKARDRYAHLGFQVISSYSFDYSYEI